MKSSLNNFRKNSPGGFTLIEAVIAIGVFGFAIAILLGLFLRSNARLREAEDRAAVTSMMPTVNAKLAAIGWDQASNGGGNGIVELTDGGPVVLVADVGASRIGMDTEVGLVPEGEQYYRLLVTRYDQPGLRYGTDVRGVMVLKVRVEWPYRLPAGSGSGFIETEENNRKQFEFISTVRP